MLQPSPDELEVAFRQIESSYPLAASDSTHQGETIYNIIKALPEASTYHRLLEQHPSLIGLLADASNGEFTLFLPVNKAWENAPGLAARVAADADDASVLAMHISEHFIDEAYLRGMTNIPTVHVPVTSNGPQVFPIRLAEDGWTVDKAGRFARPSIRASNGLIYCIDQVIRPPPPLLDVLSGKGRYATLLRAIHVSGFDEALAGQGGTLYAPSDQAFAALGPDALRFLTEDDEGKAYLKALLALHFCPENTFYTNLLWPKNNSGARRTSADKEQVHKGKMGMELPSALQRGDEAVKLAISVTRYMSCITMAVNSAPVVEQDMGGNDGVAQGIQDVLLPGGVVGKGSQDVVSKIKAALKPFI